MRKILLFGIALSLFSCSQADQVSSSTTDKEVSTIDANIGYESPYAYSALYGQYENDRFSYILKNNTNFNIEMIPFFSYGSFDDQLYATDLWPQGGGKYNVISPTSPYYSPNLTANGFKYGNFVAAESIVLTAVDSLVVIETSNPVPFQAYGNTHGFNFNYTGSPVYDVERDFLGKLGKLYFMRFKVYDDNSNLLSTSIVKVNFPHNIHSTSGPLPANWERVGISDSQFGEEMLYNTLTREICITITDERSVYKDTHAFEYDGQVYEVGIRTTSTTVEMYLEQQ